MSITIRNKALEQLIRALAAQTGETPIALVDRLTLAELNRLKTEETLQRRAAAMRRLRAQAREIFAVEDHAEIRRAMDDLYDEDGLPK